MLALSLALAATTMAGDLAGSYKCEGEGSGEKYTGTVEIAKKGDSYRLTWKLSGETNTGVGILLGDVLAVAYNGSSAGVVAYKVDGDKLVGKWTTNKGDGSLSTETLTK